MSGIVAYYLVGTGGGFLGSDGLASVDFIIGVGASDVEWFELVKYRTYNHTPLAMSLKSFVPKGPDDPDKLRVAMVLWASELFKDCPSYELVKRELEGVESMALHTGYDVPEHFWDLIEESRSVTIPEDVMICLAPLCDVDIDHPYPQRG